MACLPDRHQVSPGQEGEYLQQYFVRKLGNGHFDTGWILSTQNIVHFDFGAAQVAEVEVKGGV